MTRREWINLAGSTAGVALGPFEYLRAQSIDMGGGATIKLGIASYSFRKFSRAEAIEMTKKIGTPYINIKDFHLKLDSTPEQIDVARREFADAGLILVGCGNVSFPDSDSDAQRHAKFRVRQACRISADRLRTHPSDAAEAGAAGEGVRHQDRAAQSRTGG